MFQLCMDRLCCSLCTSSMKAVPGSKSEAEYSSKHTKQQDNIVSQHNAQSKAWQSMAKHGELYGRHWCRCSFCWHLDVAEYAAIHRRYSGAVHVSRTDSIA